MIKNKLFPLLVILLLVSSCIGQDKTDLDDLGTFEGKYYHLESGEVYTGNVYSDDKLHGFIENGLKEGKWIEYDFTTKEKWIESWYLKGVKNGQETYYCKDGLKGRESIYKNGLKEGKEISYSCTKQKIISTTVYNQGIINGEMISYYKYPSQIKEIAEYKDGIIDGYIKRFNKKGGIIEIIEHKNGVPNGKWILYDDEKNIISEETYSNGRLVTTKK